MGQYHGQESSSESPKTKDNNSTFFVLVAGGTGGHVFPAIAMAQHLQRAQLPCVLLTDTRGARFIEPYEALFQTIVMVPKGIRGFFTALNFLKSLPGVPKRCLHVVGFGGGMSVLPALAGRWLGGNVSLMQADAVMGRANKMLALVAKTIFSPLPFGRWQHKIHLCPCPLRREFFMEMPEDSGFWGEFTPSHPLRILILGGSQGARIWTELFPKACAMLSAYQRSCLHIVHQGRPEHCTELTQAYASLALQRVSVQSFFHDMPEQIRDCHIAFSRAGALSLAELGTIGRCAFLIPYPYARDNHQRENARLFVAQGGGWVLDEKDIHPKDLARHIAYVLENPQDLHKRAQAIAQHHNTSGAHEMFRVLMGFEQREP